MRSVKWLFGIGLVLQMLLCVMAWLHYKERLVLPDDANYLFEMLSNRSGLAVFHNRFVAVFTQVLPWTGIQCSAPLETVARLYSLNLELFYAACFLVCGLVLKNQRLAIGCLLTHLLITTDTFYWSVSELPLCLALLFPLSALLERPRRGAVSTLVIATLCITIAFGHSLALFAMGFCLALLWLQLPGHRRTIVIATGFYIAAIAVKSIFFRDPYDRGALGGLRNFPKLFPHYLDTPSFRDFLTRCGGDFIWLPIGLLLLTGWYFAMRAFKPALLLLAGFFGYLLLVIVCFPQEEPTRFYSENLYQPLAFFIVFAFASGDLSRLQRRMILAAIPSLVLLIGLTRIILAKDRYQQRLSWQRGLIQRFATDKVILAESAYSPKRYLLSWSSSYEFWLLSSLETGSSASVIITNNPAEAAARAGSEKKAFLPAFGLYYYDQLPRQYFPFRDTLRSYRRIDNPDSN
jgi:hypothetical protein